MLRASSLLHTRLTLVDGIAHSCAHCSIYISSFLVELADCSIKILLGLHGIRLDMASIDSHMQVGDLDATIDAIGYRLWLWL